MPCILNVRTKQRIQFITLVYVFSNTQSIKLRVLRKCPKRKW